MLHINIRTKSSSPSLPFKNLPLGQSALLNHYKGDIHSRSCCVKTFENSLGLPQSLGLRVPNLRVVQFPNNIRESKFLFRLLQTCKIHLCFGFQKHIRVSLFRHRMWYSYVPDWMLTQHIHPIYLNKQVLHRFPKCRECSSPQHRGTSS